jgi:hypothetical protein
MADAIAHAAVDAAGIVICGGSLSGLFYLIVNDWGRNAIREASLQSMYSMALVPLNSGIMVAKAATDIVCNISEEFLLSVLTSHLGEELKKKEIEEFFTKFNLTTHNDRINFVICIVGLTMFLLKGGYMESFLLLIHQILEAVRSGRMGRFLARLILRILRRRGAPVDPETI